MDTLNPPNKEDINPVRLRLVGMLRLLMVNRGMDPLRVNLNKGMDSRLSILSRGTGSRLSRGRGNTDNLNRASTGSLSKGNMGSLSKVNMGNLSKEVGWAIRGW